VAELGGRELLGEWRKAMDSMVASAASVGARTPIPDQMIEAMQRQLELVQEVVERERRVQKELASHLIAPVDAIFDLLEESGVILRRQAEALEAAGRALQDSAGLVKTQAELLERTVRTLREPAERAKAAAGLDRHKGQSSARDSDRGGPA
jgi:hypothetical protein